MDEVPFSLLSRLGSHSRSAKMTKRSMLAVAVVLIAVGSTVAMASLYSWNDSKRPAISLADALAKAEKLLGEDAANLGLFLQRT
jgi:hypothetical protein